MTQVINAKAAAEGMGKLYKVIGVTSIHGESNHVEGTTAAAYESYLNEWQNDYETDVKFITGQTQNIPLFIDQMSSWTGYNTATSVIPSAQLSASENNTKINLVGPKYFLDYADEAHLISNSYRLLGEYYAKAIKKVVFDHESWVPLSPKSIVRKDNIIYAQFNVPAGPLTIDTTNVLEKENYGFEYWDDSGNPVSINSVEILDDNKVKITLSSVPTGNNQKLRYAYTGTSGSAPGAMVEGSARGNIRDNDSTPSLYGDNLYNWLVHFDKSINNDTAGPVISDIKDDKSNNNAVALSWSTNEESSTQIEYGLSDSDTINTAEEDTVNFTTSHSVNMSNLAACSVFKYRVKSKDLAQNQTVSGFQYFTTPGCAGDSDISSFKSLKITNASGGSIGLFDSDNNGLSLTIPNEFSGQDAHFQIKKLLKNSVLGAIGTPNGKDLVGDEIYDLKALSDAFTQADNASIHQTLAECSGQIRRVGGVLINRQPTPGPERSTGSERIAVPTHLLDGRAWRAPVLKHCRNEKRTNHNAKNTLGTGRAFCCGRAFLGRLQTQCGYHHRGPGRDFPRSRRRSNQR
jgi:hypothetical protein